jgi:hypothetical protein
MLPESSRTVSYRVPAAGCAAGSEDGSEGGPGVVDSGASGTAVRVGGVTAPMLLELSATVTVRAGGALTLDSVRGASGDDGAVGVASCCASAAGCAAGSEDGSEGGPGGVDSGASGTAARVGGVTAPISLELSATGTVLAGGASTLDSVRGASDDDGAVGVASCSTLDCVDGVDGVDCVDGGGGAAAVSMDEGSNGFELSAATFGAAVIGSPESVSEVTVEGAV